MARDPIDVKRAAIVSAIVLGATLAPLVRDPADDSFPLSTYPMFAQPRSRVLVLDYAFGVTASNARMTLSPRIAGTGEVLQAAMVFDDAVRAGPRALEPLCARIAERVAADPAYTEVVGIRIVEGTHDAWRYFEYGELGRESERWRCKVAR